MDETLANCKKRFTVINFMNWSNQEKHLENFHKEQWNVYKQEKATKSKLPTKPKLVKRPLEK